MNFCSTCGSKIFIDIPAGDHRPRHQCTNCQEIFYQNPRVITGTLPVFQGKILLCKRGIEPRANYWTIPGGFMENGETMAEGAIRETEEEACAKVSIQQLISVISLPEVNQIHCFYLARMKDDSFEATPESIEIELVNPENIPWDEIAFKTVKQTLEHYLKYRDQTQIPLLETAIWRKKL